MHQSDVIVSLVLSAHALARIGAHDAHNDAPSAQWRTLSTLEREGPLRVGELAHLARMTQPGTTRLLKDLTDKGFVLRRDDLEDSRVTIVELSPAGHTALTHWRTELRDTLAPRFADLSADDWEALHRAAHILAQSTNFKEKNEE